MKKRLFQAIPMIIGLVILCSFTLNPETKGQGQTGSVCPGPPCYKMKVSNMTSCDLDFFFEYDSPCGDVYPATNPVTLTNTVMAGTSTANRETLLAYEMSWCDDPCICPSKFKFMKSGSGAFFAEPWAPLAALTAGPYPWTVTYSGWGTCNGTNICVKVTVISATECWFDFYSC